MISTFTVNFFCTLFFFIDGENMEFISLLICGIKLELGGSNVEDANLKFDL